MLGNAEIKISKRNVDEEHKNLGWYINCQMTEILRIKTCGFFYRIYKQNLVFALICFLVNWINQLC